MGKNASSDPKQYAIRTAECIDKIYIEQLKQQTIVIVPPAPSSSLYQKPNQWLYDCMPRSNYVLLIEQAERKAIRQKGSQSEYIERGAYLVDRQTGAILKEYPLSVGCYGQKNGKSNIHNTLKTEATLTNYTQNCKFYEIGTFKGDSHGFPSSFMLMPYFKGKPLSDSLDEVEKLSFTKRLELVCKTIDQYQRCHKEVMSGGCVISTSIIHGNPKGLLVYLYRKGDDVRVLCQLTDFSQAILTSPDVAFKSQQERHPAIKDTLLPPEMKNGNVDKLTVASDMYILGGLILSELHGENRIPKLHDILESFKSLFLGIDPLVSNQIYNKICSTLELMLSKNPNDRPPLEAIGQTFNSIYRLCELIEKYWLYDEYEYMQNKKTLNTSLNNLSEELAQITKSTQDNERDIDILNNCDEDKSDEDKSDEDDDATENKMIVNMDEIDEEVAARLEMLHQAMIMENKQASKEMNGKELEWRLEERKALKDKEKNKSKELSAKKE